MSAIQATVNVPFLTDFKKNIGILGHVLVKILCMNFHENPSNGNPVGSLGYAAERTDGHDAPNFCT
jgi:hypothetical protein